MGQSRVGAEVFREVAAGGQSWEESFRHQDFLEVSYLEIERVGYNTVIFVPASGRRRNRGLDRNEARWLR
jgi:hypothetical protein